MKRREETYRKELLEEASKYGIPKPKVEIRSGVDTFLGQNPEYGKMPIGKFVNKMEIYGAKSAKKGAEMLSKEGVKTGKLKRLTISIGSPQKISKIGWYRGGEYERGKKSIKLHLYRQIDKKSFAVTHEMVHKILDSSAFGEYERSNAQNYETAHHTYTNLCKERQTAREKHFETGEQRHSNMFRVLQDECWKAAEIDMKMKSAYKTSQAINEAIAFAVTTAVGGGELTKKGMKVVDDMYSAPISPLYTKSLKMINKVGVKQTLEAARKINPIKAEKSKRFFKSFDDMYKKTMRK